jgi:HTH-type transcriptional regulator / antitoxin HigA
MWLRDFPVTELVKRDILPAEPADKTFRLEQLPAFFGVATVGAWQEVYADLPCAFRTTQAHGAKPGAPTAWLRLGELAARDTSCEPYDHKRLEEALPSIRALTREGSEVFIERLHAICAPCGVAVVFVPELRGSRASGVTRWLTPAKALIQLSFRYRTNDHLWFTFFHEIGHVLRHGKTDIWIEATTSPDNPREAEADSFARHTHRPSRRQEVAHPQDPGQRTALRRDDRHSARHRRRPPPARPPMALLAGRPAQAPASFPGDTGELIKLADAGP